MFKKEIIYENCTKEEALSKFLLLINAKQIDALSFIYNKEKWFVDFHPFNHSDDIIINEKDMDQYDNFLLIKTGTIKHRIAGWTTQEELKKIPKRDIYRNNNFFYMVNDINIKDLSFFKIAEDNLLKSFIINEEKAASLGREEMTNGILAGLHFFAKKANLFFKNLNQSDECEIDGKKIKIYVRDAFSDEDILIKEKYFQTRPEIDIFISCKKKGGNLNYVGYINREIVEETRIVQMIGSDSNSPSEEIRRIFAEQLKNLSDFIKIEDENIESEEEIIRQNYIPLHMHSEYSVGDGFGKIDYLVENIYKKGFAGAALTDHGTMKGVLSFQRKMAEKGLKSIIGNEFYVSFNGEKENHLIILVKNEIGWKNILELQNIAVRKNFYYRPILPFEKLLEYKEGLIILSACSRSRINELISANREAEAEELILLFKENFKEDFYLEMQPHTIKDNQEVLRKIHNLAIKHNIECVFTTDSHYPNKEDIKYHKAIKAINFKQEYEKGGFNDDCFYLMQDIDIEEWIEGKTFWMKPFIETWKLNTIKIMEKINFKIEKTEEKDTLPKIVFEGITRADKLKQLAIEGLGKHTPYKYEGKIKERLDLELNRVIEKGYENYFLIVWDLIKWAKGKNIICGPGRGSVGASLLAYALNITECDPIKYNLLFDRFLSEIRKDMPDVDMDFMDDRRYEIFDYLKEKYGEEHCAKVITYSRFHPKGIMRDMGRIFNIPIKDIEKICSLVLERSGGDARASFGLQDTFSEFEEAKKFKEKYPLASEIAEKLEGHLRHLGIHAAALIITENDLHKYVPICKIGGEIATEWEKQQCEDMNLIKFDILGLKTLSIINDVCKEVGCQLPKEYNDIEVYKNIFQNGNTKGIFQFNTVGMTKFITQYKIEEFKELYDSTTLFRPSALHSGQAQSYVNRKNKKETTEAAHFSLNKITEETLGLILYQEQVMQIMKDIGNMSWATAEMSRKVMTKSKGKDAMNKLRNDFIIGAENKHGINQEEASKIFDVVSTFGSYGFNKAHAVEYSIISYYCAWLKHYYPLQFYKAILKYENEDSIIKDIFSEINNLNVDIEYPDINKSELFYSIKDNKIYAGFNSIKGVDTKATEKIIKNRPFANFEDFIKRCNLSKNNTLGLIVADAFREFSKNKKKLIKLFENGNKTLFDIAEEDYNDFEWSALIYQHTTLKPKINIAQSFNWPKLNYKNINETESLGNKVVILRGLVTDVLKKDRLLRGEWDNHTHKYERHMIYLNLQDDTGNMALQIMPNIYEKHKIELQCIKNKAIIALGVLSKDGKKMYLSMLQILNENKTVENFLETYKNINKEKDKSFILSINPAISKKEKSYYRIKLFNGIEGLLFDMKEKYFPGDYVSFNYKEPFLNLTKVI